MKYRDYEKLNLPQISSEVLKHWEDKNVFEQSIQTREGAKKFVFYEGPPSANGMPGIHHVMARAIKDIFCRFQTLNGHQVHRKAGWDTHGLPVELGVEKELGITKEDIGKKISVEEYNSACKKAVMRYTDIWNDLTRKMGYWVDMDDPYITYTNKYIESVWWLLNKLYSKGLIYKGYTIQPYSPKAGTGLSSHELNQPGTYRDVKDTSAVAQFKVAEGSVEQIKSLLDKGKNLDANPSIIAWTTTPWTLPSNTALAVGPKIDYVLVNSINKYDDSPISVILAEALLSKHFNNPEKQAFEVVARFKGKAILDVRYEQLLPFHLPMDSPEEAFRVILGDFVTTEDGTGVVHIAPTFGADDARVAQKAGVPPLLVSDENGKGVPLVDLQGKFIDGMGDLSGMYVKNDYYDQDVPEKSVDVIIAIQLKTEGKAFHVEKYQHSYPHCWRTDKPVLYYPLDSWFIKATASKDRMVELNNEINWKPASTGTGRFGNWLENLNDWNLSRSRYWGIPIPIWRTEDSSEEICIGSVEQLKKECQKAVEAGLMSTSPLASFEPGNMENANYETFDLHKHIVDDIVLLSSTGEPMYRESDLIDVWFDSGSMPYAQWHYPFENKEKIDDQVAFPADFIAEGVDQTRGWFYTLHAIATMCFDSLAYKTVISNGLVLDKNGQKMSKRLGNAVDPFSTIENYGPDATRWYLITNAQPWDNLKFDEEGITEVQRKFFRALHNTYAFFALYANVDDFSFKEEPVALEQRPEIDRWVISRLNSLKSEVHEAFSDYEPTKAGRAIQNFVTEELSNWYVRLCRRRFWKGSYSEDKIAAYQTLYECLETIAIIASPIAPFYCDRLFQDLNDVSGKHKVDSVHLADFPLPDEKAIDRDLESMMDIAQKVSSMVLGLRKKEKIRVRQPLQKIIVPILDDKFESLLRKVEGLILSEVNVKELKYVRDDEHDFVKQIKANFKSLGPRFGKMMKALAAQIQQLDQDQIAQLEKEGSLEIMVDGQSLEIGPEDVEITTKDIEGWTVASANGMMVALDVNISEQLRDEGLAREFVNRVQNLRKDAGLEVTDRIKLEVLDNDVLSKALKNNLDYICAETLAGDVKLVEALKGGRSIDLGEGILTSVSLLKLQD